jgi:hypothetical protein
VQEPEGWARVQQTDRPPAALGPEREEPESPARAPAWWVLQTDRPRAALAREQAGSPVLAREWLVRQKDRQPADWARVPAVWTERGQPARRAQ